MRAELANLNHCAVPFLSRTVVNLYGYYITIVELRKIVHRGIDTSKHLLLKSIRNELKSKTCLCYSGFPFLRKVYY